MIVTSNKTKIVLLALLSFIFISFFFIALIFGTEPLPLTTIKALFQAPSENLSVSELILLKVRLPRVILTIGVGGSLALAGMLVQAIFRNPLVEPYT